MKFVYVMLISFFPIYSQGFNKIYNENVNYDSIESIKKSYKSYVSNEIFLKKISQECDFVTYHSIGITHNGLEIPAINITSTNKKDKVSILFNCAHHANELISTEHCYDIIYQIINDKKLNYLDYVSIWVVPIVNPDGSKIFWEQSINKGRKNSKDVDLNRNYPFMWGIGKGSSNNKNHQFYRGIHPLSESESSAISELAKNNGFLFSVSYHADGKKLLIPYTINNVINPNENYPKIFGEKIAGLINYKPVKNLYPVNGTDQDYLYFKYGTVAFLLESEKNNPPYSEVNDVVIKTTELWREMINEAIFGNKIFLKITDEDEKPLIAKIEIEEIKHYNGEEYYSSPKGLFYRMVLNENYTISISAKNYITQKIICKSTKNNDLKIIKMKSY